MGDYGENKKQICFETATKTHADLKVRLHYDEIKIREFFNKITLAYIDKNENVMAFIKELKEKKGVSQTRRNKAEKIEKQQQEITRQYALDKNDIESIFDILEKEHPDL